MSNRHIPVKIVDIDGVVVKRYLRARHFKKQLLIREDGYMAEFNFIKKEHSSGYYIYQFVAIIKLNK